MERALLVISTWVCVCVCEWIWKSFHKSLKRGDKMRWDKILKLIFTNLLIKLSKISKVFAFWRRLVWLLRTNSYFATISRWKFPLSMHLQSSSFDLFYVFQHRIFPQKSTHSSSIYERNFRKKLLCRPYTKYMRARE